LADAACTVDPASPCQVRAIQRGDLVVIDQWLADEAMQAVMEDEPGGPTSIRRRLRGLVGCDPVRDRECAYLVNYQGRAIGFFHLKYVNWISRTCEIDVMVEPSTQRSLLGLWVVSKIAEVCFDQLNLRKAYGYIFASNQASARFFSRLGPIEATLKAGRRPPRGDEDVHIAALTAESYREMRKRYKWDEFIKGRGRGA
jgi:RimJ/RimL family protein N-acetyltransferase